MPWHGHHATLPSETFLEAAWGLVEGSWVALEDPWTALGKVFGGSWEVLDGFQEASWAKDNNSYNFSTIFEKKKTEISGVRLGDVLTSKIVFFRIPKGYPT